MKKIACFVVFVTVVSWFPIETAAKTTVEVSGNGANSRSSVTVNNTVNTNISQNSSQFDTHTKIRVEANGVVKSYELDQPGDVNIESSDGSAKVTVRNRVGVPASILSPSPILFATPSASISASSVPSSVQLDQTLQFEDLFTRLENLFRKLFPFFHW